MLMLPSPEMTLQYALDQIAVQEQEWIDAGHCVGVLVKDIKHWAECGVYTARDLDALFAAEASKEARKAAYDQWDEDYERWLDEMERDPAYIAEREREAAEDEQRAREIDACLAVPAFAETEFYRVCGHYQAGWA